MPAWLDALAVAAIVLAAAAAVGRAWWPAVRAAWRGPAPVDAAAGASPRAPTGCEGCGSGRGCGH